MLKGFRDAWLCANNRLSRLPFNFYEISYPEFALKYSEFNLNQYNVANSLMYYVYTAVAVALP
ncbi:hypothetical protein [Wielerella bovis]|uniref:hypothetical protein n=1 Tax=Wielerella bovis TaxID=2917790 RepID=UPI0020195318|nr:hypothetical protein [Wielerella bovis]ULJ60996.1 hypothetical protein MIS44_03850 [Wielerella bovis]